jgi:exosortase/archaeosortase family protein
VLRVLLLFLSFIIAYPSSLSLKIRWSIYSIIFLELLNIFRIVVLSWVLINYPQYFNFMHDYVLSVILLLIVAIFYYKYINIANQNFSIITSKIDKG